MRVFLILLSVLALVACGGSDRRAKPSTAKTYTRFADADPHPWRGAKPWNYPVHGVDVSKYQGVIDWRRLKSNGVEFAFIKATEGGDHLDSRFAINWRAADRAGVPRGAYHFYYFCSSAISQANWFIRNVPKTRGALPPVLDMEWNHASRSCKRKPNGVTVRRDMQTFLSRVERHYGQKPIIYTTVDFYQQNALWRVRGAEFWLRSVAGHPAQKYGSAQWQFWQYTGSGLMPGVKGRIDINAFNGSRKDWKTWLKRRRN